MNINVDWVSREVTLIIMITMIFVTDYGNITEIAGLAGWAVAAFYAWIFYIDSKCKGVSP